MKFSTTYVPLLLGVAVAAGVLLGSRLNFSNKSVKLFSSNKKKEKLNRLIDYIDFEYVDEINTDSIVDVTVNSILENLDPHSVYISPKNLKQVTESMQGDFIGIGINYYVYKDTITVINTIENGPSQTAGILAGDRILMADTDTIYGKKLLSENLADKLKGALESNVRLQLFRPGKGVFDVALERGKVPLQSVDAGYMLTDCLGYIKINRFAETTYKEFKKALSALLEEGAEQLVIDLRDNGGGFITPSIKIADEFLENGKLVMFTKNKKGAIENNFATDQGAFENGMLYLLQNENSASASEILAGAIQDNDRGTIIGRRSFGKGLVQREMELGDGSAVRLTISRYYTPTGRSIQRPYENGNEAYFNEYLERYKNGELQSSDSIKLADSLRFKTPLGKVVYGGGGIIPDIFVGKSTTRMQETLNFALRSGFMGRFVFEEMDKDRLFYNNLDILELKALSLKDDLLERFTAYSNERNMKMDLGEYKDQAKKYIKAIMAQQLFGSSAFEQLLNDHDTMIQKVIEMTTVEMDSTVASVSSEE